MKRYIKSIIIGAVIGITFVICSFFLQTIYYNSFLKQGIEMEIKNELKKIQQERMKEFRKQLKQKEKKC